MSASAIIRLLGVRKRYGEGAHATTALDGLTLEIGRGAFVALMGPSGSGKSTVLSLMAGLDAPDAGRIVLDGHDLAALVDRQRASLRLATVGFVFQAFNLIPALTVGENVSWPLEFSGYGRAEVRRRTKDALARVGVDGRERRHPGELSGGEQQRVAIARAIATEPSVLLADEPTGNLDSHAGQKILELLRTLNRSAGVTVVMATHSAVAARYGERTLELQDGRIVRDAPAE